VNGEQRTLNKGVANGEQRTVEPAAGLGWWFYRFWRSYPCLLVL